MERYNIFQLVHKGLRAALYQTALQLQQTDFMAEEERTAAINSVKEIVMLFESHAHKEDSFVLPAIQAFEPSVVATFEAEHVTDMQLGENLQKSLELLETPDALDDITATGARLTEDFVAFTVFNLRHMAKEEDLINKILWRYYTDDEIKKISGQITASVEPWMQDFFSTWMLRGISNPEAITWMKAIERGMPAVVYQTLLQKAEKELPNKRYYKVTQSLKEQLSVY